MKRLALAVPMIACSCATTTSTPRTASELRSEVERYFPLVDGHIYTYETTKNDSTTRDMFMLNVRRFGPTSAELKTGSTSKGLTITATAIARDSGGFILKSPLSQGNQWTGDNETTVVIDAVGLSVKVPAGSFNNCLRTVQAGSSGTVTTVFCPDVGIVEMRAEQMSGSSTQSEQVLLRSFGPPVDLK